MKILYIIALSALIFTGCEKIIEIDYRSMEQMYVIEGYTTGAGSSVRITRTSDMDSPLDTTAITTANVLITDADGVIHTLTPNEFGFYESSSASAKDNLGRFSISVEIEDKLFTSYADLMPTSEALPIKMELMSVPGPAQPIFMQVEIKEDTTADRYFFYTIFHNQNSYKSGIAYKLKEDSLPLLFSTAVAGYIDGKPQLFDDDETPLVDQDQFMVSLNAIDKRTFDYIESLYLIDNTNSNPLENFTGGCLGYYTVFKSNTLFYTFDPKAIIKE